jgi:hypothetical protein
MSKRIEVYRHRARWCYDTITDGRRRAGGTIIGLYGPNRRPAPRAVRKAAGMKGSHATIEYVERAGKGAQQ